MLILGVGWGLGFPQQRNSTRVERGEQGFLPSLRVNMKDRKLEDPTHGAGLHPKIFTEFWGDVGGQ